MKTFNNIPFPIDKKDPNYQLVKTRIKTLINQLFGGNKGKQVGDRYILTVDFGWAKEVHIWLEPKDVDRISIGVFPCNTKRQASILFSRKDPLHWIGQHKLGHYDIDLKCFVQFYTNFGSSKAWIDLDTNAALSSTHTPYGFYKYVRRWKKNEWNTFDQDFSKIIQNWKTRKGWDGRESFLEQFENKRRNTFNVSFPFLVTAKIPYNEIQELDQNPSDLIKHIESIIEDLRKMIDQKRKKKARICWNDNEWVMPSGALGKSSLAQSFEKQYGYGHEEWLFDFDKTIDGWQYGFLTPIYQHHKTYEEATFDVTLYAINAETKTSYWIGEIRNLEVITTDQYEKALAKYKENSWINEMKVQIAQVGGNPDGIENWMKEQMLFNVRFKKEWSIIYENPIPDRQTTDLNEKRYKLYNTSIKDTEAIQTAKSVGFDFHNTGNHGERSQKERTTIERIAQKKELELTHNKLSDSFLTYLQEKHSQEKVKRECRAFGQNRIDIVQHLGGNEYIFYEIKTYNDLLYSLRMALGQLLEYAFYKEESHKVVKELVLVSNQEPDQSFEEYLYRLNQVISIPISYMHFDLEECEVKEFLQLDSTETEIMN